MDEFSFSGFLWRLVFSVALVLLTFNPTGHSYYHWLLDGFPSITPGEAVAGIVLLGAWIFFVRSTFAAMGALGVGLLLALFAVDRLVGHEPRLAGPGRPLRDGLGRARRARRRARRRDVVVAHPPADLGPGVGGPSRHLSDRCRWSDPSDLALPNPTDPTTGTSYRTIFISFALKSLYGG